MEISCAAGSVLKGNQQFCNWGRHTATNEFADVRHVILAGVLQYNVAQYEAAGRAAKKATVEDEFSDQEFYETRIGEVSHHIFQAACRGYVRKTINGTCPEGCHLYAVFSTHPKTGLPKGQLSVIFPEATVVEWQAVDKEPTGKVKEAIEYISDYLTRYPGKELPASDVMDKTGIDRRNWGGRVANHSTFEPALAALRVGYLKGRGSKFWKLDWPPVE
ncbi:hypothetical protein ACSBOB_19250 [Mesorhizobium sp. ASY16-5R]|uniref:hypothetical protein n=1 Tax=Mesorhizobium sp. ASY16-5R TaxID=3445772 RepID=UPI003F9F38BB